MRIGWEKAPLGSLCKIYQPKTLTLKELDPKGRYDVFGANGIIGKHSQYNHTDSELLMGCRGSCGALNFSTPYSWINGNAMVIHPISDVVSTAYLKYYLEGIDKQSVISGTTIPQITAKSLSPLVVFYPSSKEQQRIVDILDQEFAKIDALKANAEKSLQAAKDLFQATLKKELEPKEGWLNTTIGDLCESVKYGTSKPSSSTGRHTYLRMNNITNDGFLTLADTKRIDITAEEEEKYLVCKGDILFNRTNSRELVGKSCVFQEDEQMVIAGYIIRLRLKNGINPCFVSYYINYEPVRAELRKLSVGAVHQANINAKTIQSFRIALPDNREEQDGIVDVLSHAYRTISNLQENYQKALTLCDELKQSLLRKAFNGEL